MPRNKPPMAPRPPVTDAAPRRRREAPSTDPLKASVSRSDQGAQPLPVQAAPGELGPTPHTPSTYSPPPTSARTDVSRPGPRSLIETAVRPPRTDVSRPGPRSLIETAVRPRPSVTGGGLLRRTTRPDPHGGGWYKDPQSAAWQRGRPNELNLAEAAIGDPRHGYGSTDQQGGGLLGYRPGGSGIAPPGTPWGPRMTIPSPRPPRDPNARSRGRPGPAEPPAAKRRAGIVNRLLFGETTSGLTSAGGPTPPRPGQSGSGLTPAGGITPPGPTGGTRGTDPASVELRRRFAAATGGAQQGGGYDTSVSGLGGAQQGGGRLATVYNNSGSWGRSDHDSRQMTPADVAAAWDVPAGVIEKMIADGYEFSNEPGTNEWYYGGPGREMYWTRSSEPTGALKQYLEQHAAEQAANEQRAKAVSAEEQARAQQKAGWDSALAEKAPASAKKSSTTVLEPCATRRRWTQRKRCASRWRWVPAAGR